MAVVSTKLQSAMVIKYKTGVDEKGNDVFATQRFSKIAVGAQDADILAVSQSIGSLLNFPVNQVVREDQNSIINQ